LKNDASLRSALRIFTILENNKAFFLKAMEEQDYALIMKMFEDLAHVSASKYNSAEFKEGYSRACSMLSYRLDRLI
jgi:hypothetical protein